MLIEPNYKSRLNQPQLSALDNFPGQMLIVAGAGTGKTSTIVAKIVHAIESGFATPGQILATTFTNKAALELKHRLKYYLGEAYREIIIGTFHSISLEILQKNIDILGVSAVNVLPYDDQIQIVRNLIAKHGPKEARAGLILEKIQRYKEEPGIINGVDTRLMNYYQEELRKSNMMDFADLLLNTIQLFEKNPQVREYYQQGLKLICVDEYQDINDLQHRWVGYIHKDNHLCCVGDPDQAIYGFRGANANHILNFKSNYQSAQIVKLELNYRSTKNILDSANKLIANNRNRIPKELQAGLTTENRKVQVQRAYTGRAEAEFMSNEICNIRGQETDPEKKASIAILVRSRVQIPDIEESLLKHQISYKLTGGMQLLDRAEIKDLMSYFKFLNNPQDFIAFGRMMQSPRRGIGEVTINKIISLAQDQNYNLLEGCKIVAQGSAPVAKAKLESLILLIEQGIKLRNGGLIPLANHFYINSQYIDSLSPDRRENVQNWIRTLGEFASLEEYMEKVLWQADADSSNTNHEVQVMTIHASKGLEFDYVFLPGWDEGILPHDFAITQADLEEERRLAYVAITRARKHAVISHANTRMINGKIKSYTPSRFLVELKLMDAYQKSTKGQLRAGSEVIHPRFGVGMIQEIGTDIARVRFSGVVRLVEVRALRSL